MKQWLAACFSGSFVFSIALATTTPPAVIYTYSLTPKSGGVFDAELLSSLPTGSSLTSNPSSPPPIESFSVVYGSDNPAVLAQAYSLPQNYVLSSSTPLGNGLYRLNYTFQSAYAKPSTSVTFGGMVYGENGYGGTTPTSFSQVYGLFQDVTINGQSATLSLSAPYGVNYSIPSNNHVLGGYYADWTIYGGHNYDIAQIPFNYLNTITYGFGKIDPQTGEAIVLDPFADYGKASSSHVTALPYLALERAANSTLNLIYSFGGWGTIDTWNSGVSPNHEYTSGDFSVLFEYYPQNIPTLAENMVSAIAKVGFNGIDIDYEWPAPAETQAAILGSSHTPLCAPQAPGVTCNTLPLDQKEADGYAELMYDLSQDLQSLHAQTGQTYLLSTALLSGADKLETLNGFKYQGSIPALQGQSDLAIVLNSVNHINLMSYDMHGAFDAPASVSTATGGNVSNFQAPLGVDPIDTSPTTQYSIQGAINAIAHLAPGDVGKIILGVPLYARLEQVDPSHTNPVNKTNPRAVPQNYLDDGLYLTLAPADTQSLDAVGYGEFAGDVWSQDASGNSTDTAASGSITAGIRGSGTFDYKCIVNPTYCIMQTSSDTPEALFGAFKASNPNYYQLASINTPGTPGAASETPWAYSPTQNAFMSFDNGNSAFHKALYANQQGLAGVFVWEVDGDVPNTDPNYPADSVIYNLWKGTEGTPKTAPSEGQLVGYLDLSAAATPTLEDAVSHGYNMVVIGWGDVNGNTVAIDPDTLSHAPQLSEDIATAHSEGARVLLTFGGENNTFNPPASQTPTDAEDIAQGMSTLMTQYGLDGIDFDLESVSYSANFVEEIIRDLKELQPNVIISGAPQISAWINPQEGGGTIGFSPAIWNQLASSGLFTYIWVQDYNQGGGGQIYINGKVLEDMDPGFLAASYDDLLSLPYTSGATCPETSGCTQVQWQAGTHLIIGEPSTSQAGNGENQPADITADLDCLATGQNCVAGVVPHQAYTVPGLMTWSVGWDAQNHWAFADGLKACVLSSGSICGQQ